LRLAFHPLFIEQLLGIERGVQEPFHPLFESVYKIDTSISSFHPLFIEQCGCRWICRWWLKLSILFSSSRVDNGLVLIIELRASFHPLFIEQLCEGSLVNRVQNTINSFHPLFIEQSEDYGLFRLYRLTGTEINAIAFHPLFIEQKGTAWLSC
jgi:hypothetical protein